MEGFATAHLDQVIRSTHKLPFKSFSADGGSVPPLAQSDDVCFGRLSSQISKHYEPAAMADHRTMTVRSSLDYFMDAALPMTHPAA